jgi:hypothetical protein
VKHGHHYSACAADLPPLHLPTWHATLQVISCASSSVADALFMDASTGRLWLSEEEEDSRELQQWRVRRCKPLLHKLMEKRNMTLQQVGASGVCVVCVGGGGGAHDVTAGESCGSVGNTRMLQQVGGFGGGEQAIVLQCVNRELQQWRHRRCKPLLHKLKERRNMTLQQVGA